VLIIGPAIRAFRGRRIFNGDKNPQHDFLRKGNKAIGPMEYIYSVLKNHAEYEKDSS
jgi:hypothetical protein